MTKYKAKQVALRSKCFDSPVVMFSENGHSGAGWYAYEEDHPEEGSIFLGAGLMCSGEA